MTFADGMFVLTFGVCGNPSSPLSLLFSLSFSVEKRETDSRFYVCVCLEFEIEREKQRHEEKEGKISRKKDVKEN